MIVEGQWPHGPRYNPTRLFANSMNMLFRKTAMTITASSTPTVGSRPRKERHSVTARTSDESLLTAPFTDPGCPPNQHWPWWQTEEAWLKGPNSPQAPKAAGQAA